MSWLTADARLDLRTLISDGDQDKLGYLKQVINDQNGTNKIFKTVDSRRVTDFTTATGPEGVYLDNDLLSPSDVTADETVIGQFNFKL